MSRRFSWIAVEFLIMWQFACGGGTTKQSSTSTPSGAPLANISISPGSAVVGSPDLTLTVSGSKNFTFSSTPHKLNLVVWSQGGTDTNLATTFVSSSEVTAILPASLLTGTLTANVRVEIWDKQGISPTATSNSVPFQVTSTPVPTPFISSISPLTAVAGSPDTTITINGSDFGHYGHFVWSTAFWTTNGNLHDTGTWLQTTIVGDNQLTAVIPAKLLRSPSSVQIVVMNGDVMGMSDGFFGYPRSNSVTFAVIP